MINYAPRTGSIPARVIAHLECLPHGTELATAVLADALDLDPTSIPSCLEYAIKHGMVVREKRDGLVRWKLGAGESAALRPDPTEPDEDPIVQRVVSAAALGLPPPELVKKPPRKVFFSAPQADLPKAPLSVAPVAHQPANDVPRLRIALWSDGMLVVERGPERIVFARRETEQLVRYLERLGEATA